MQKSFQIRVSVVLLAFFTLSAVICACFNFYQEAQEQTPFDGVTWFEAAGGLRAHRVFSGGPGERAGIKPGDLLVEANGHPTPHVASLERQMFHTKPYGTATYTVIRDGYRVELAVILEAADRSLNQGFRFIALVYLGIGLYVLFRRWTAPRSTHFYIFCLASFVLYSFKYSDRFTDFDWVIYWGNVLATALQPALFLHFALAFPEDKRLDKNRRWLIALTYVPAVAIVGLRITAINLWSATALLDDRLNKFAYAYLATCWVLASGVFYISYRRTDMPLRRQQLKWLTRGTVLAIAPFTLLYIIPYLTDIPVPALFGKLAAISLVVLPLTFSWAIIRYRLMDVDLIFKRGVTYTLATAAVVGLYFLLVSIAGEFVHNKLPAFGSWGLIAAIILASQLFDPLKRAIQGRIDKVFDRKRYDYRQTLIEFGRGLSSETDLAALLNSIVDRLSRTLLVTQVAVFLADESGAYTLTAARGLPPSLAGQDRELDLGFLDFDQPGSGSHIFLENTQQALNLPEPQRRTVAALDLNYYLPCRLQQRTIAVIGLGRTADADFLSSEDVEVLESLASYIGIALQNARLYASLEQKASEYERLKEFNENIVESINVGILAVDLEERIESWNAQMEVLYALPRAEALGKFLSDVFPESFVTEFHRAKGEEGTVQGVHNLYKFRIETRAGEQRTANIAIAPLVSRNFATVGRIVLVDDITDRVELETQLTQAEKLSSIGLLAAGVAHEVNTPLAVISSYAQMLAKQVRGDERVGPLLDKITQQTFRASEIVNGLLNFSRTSGTAFTEININTVIQDTLNLLEHQFKTSNVRLESALDGSLPTILGNPGKLQQVFLNLFLNAKDAMAGGGTLRVATEVNGHISVSISDTGSGISPEHVKRIYDPFFTTKSAPREGQRRGTGLGLAVTYGIIQEHAGKIDVQSQAGRGTTFYLEFPLVRKPVNA
ncbi:Sensor histidine kinase [Acidisarcina polymorpha]|uniref:histidine kinase n=1 Tax=Acidisarcina polymorpha TaxID=2211140 RepID=A0A2Z5G286_9BACT|nr:ATP-binding protein [Acidisarcina polymorpha]AXC12775.1 Sensor histidine kinase [Acidisarcina polymorpha]